MEKIPNYYIAICDDDEYESEQLKNMLVHYVVKKYYDFVIDMYSSPEELISAYEKGKYQVLFLDVEMKEMNGIELAKHIRNIPDKDVHIIYVSNYSQYMSNAFDVRAFHYIEKSFTNDQKSEMEEKLYGVLDDVVKDINDSKKYIVINRFQNESSICLISDIISVHSTQKDPLSISVHCSEKDIKGITRLKEIYDQLSTFHFAYVSKWCIVNILHIKAFKKNKLIMDDDSVCAISRRYKKSFNELFSKHILML